ncbi:MAG: DUF5668 domain-containing protein [Acidimicrobiia bacterium]
MNWARIFFGSAVVAVGVVLLLDNSGVLDAGDVFSRYWPVLVIAAGLLSFFANPGHWQIPLIVVVVGTALLLRTLDVVDSLSVVVPALLILIGVFVMFGRVRPGHEVSDADRISSFNIFSGTEIASHSAEFKGGTWVRFSAEPRSTFTTPDSLPGPPSTSSPFSEGWRSRCQRGGRSSPVDSRSSEASRT